MGADSKIEWTDHTFNPWVGCTKISPACDHCYAEGWAKRSGSVQWGGDRRLTSDANWRQPLKWNRQAAAEGRRFRVFCASLADVFDNQVSVQWRIRLMRLIMETPNLDWLLLTKRIGNAAEMLETAFRGHTAQREGWRDNVPPNVWIGATVCNQEEADRDIPKLLATPASVRFLSVEPMLGPIDLSGEYLTAKLGAYPFRSLTSEHRTKLIDLLDWVIVGGESGHGARPMSPDWVRTLRDQCQAAGVAFMFKQWGEWIPMLGQAEGIAVRPEKATTLDGWVMGWAGKKAAGRKLDGSTHDGVPAGNAA